jgi:hypothetical protein
LRYFVTQFTLLNAGKSAGEMEPAMNEHIAIQDYYPNDYVHALAGPAHRTLQIESYIEGDEVVCHFQPGFLTLQSQVMYGGLIAPLIDCHERGSRPRCGGGRKPGSEPCAMTASPVDYLRPTPLGPVLERWARTRELGSQGDYVSPTAQGTAVSASHVNRTPKIWKDRMIMPATADAVVGGGVGRRTLIIWPRVKDVLLEKHEFVVQSPPANAGGIITSSAQRSMSVFVKPTMLERSRMRSVRA